MRFHSSVKASNPGVQVSVDGLRAGSVARWVLGFIYV